MAVQFLKSWRDAYSAIFWLNGKNEDTSKQTFISLAKRIYTEHPSLLLLRTAIKAKVTDQVIEAFKQWLCTRGNTQWILIFDNIDNPKLPGTQDTQAYWIESYISEVDQGSILITIRSSQLQVGKVICVKKFQSIQESIAILASMSRRPISDQGKPYRWYLSEVTEGVTQYKDKKSWFILI